jgi:hypothetical protein
MPIQWRKSVSVFGLHSLEGKDAMLVWNAGNQPATDSASHHTQSAQVTVCYGGKSENKVPYFIAAK